ncbi:hypothetical protein KCU98_g5725, partial [Aureobasidium melanogenum]
MPLSTVPSHRITNAARIPLADQLPKNSSTTFLIPKRKNAMHMIAVPSTSVSHNLNYDDNNATSSTSVQNDNSSFPWYMAEWTTPVTAVLEAYVLISFLVFLVMFLMCIHRRGCFHICHRRRRRRTMRYQQLLRRRMWNGEQIGNNVHEDSDEDVNHYEINSTQTRNHSAVDTENGDHRVQEIQRLERALRVAGMA